MSEDSEKEDYSDRTISDEDESDEDTFMKFVNEDIHQCALLTADSISDPFFPRTTQILLEYQLGRWVPRLRKPRDLYGVSSSGPLSPTRWPYHCEVIDEKIEHIECQARLPVLYSNFLPAIWERLKEEKGMTEDEMVGWHH